MADANKRSGKDIDINIAYTLGQKYRYRQMRC